MLAYKLALPDDNLVQIRDYVIAAVKETPHKEPEVENITQLCWSCMRDGVDRVIFLMMDDEELVGLVMGVVTSNVLYPSVAQEILWHVKPEYRGKNALKLFQLFDDWAKLAPYSTVSYFSNGPDLSRTYERFGYQPIEISYLRKN